MKLSRCANISDTFRFVTTLNISTMSFRINSTTCLIQTTKNTPMKNLHLKLIPILFVILIAVACSPKVGRKPHPLEITQMYAGTAPRIQFSELNKETYDLYSKYGHTKDGAYLIIDQQPKFPDGENAYLKYLYSFASNPEDDIADKTLIAEFIVYANGEIGKVKLLNSISPEHDRLALNIVLSMPKWKPGIYKGKTVDTWHAAPIYFYE